MNIHGTYAKCAATILLATSTSLAGFNTFVTNAVTVDSGLVRVDVYAQATGTGAARSLRGVQLLLTSSPGSKSIWHSNSAGFPDVRNVAEVENRSFIRVNHLEPASNTGVYAPVRAWTFEPALGPETVSMSDPMSAEYAVQYTFVQPALPLGALFASLILSANFSGSISGTLFPTSGFAPVPFGPITINAPEPTSIASLAIGTILLRRCRRRLARL